MSPDQLRALRRHEAVFQAGGVGSIRHADLFILHNRSGISRFAHCLGLVNPSRHTNAGCSYVPHDQSHRCISRHGTSRRGIRVSRRCFGFRPQPQICRKCARSWRATRRRCSGSSGGCQAYGLCSRHLHRPHDRVCICRLRRVRVIAAQMVHGLGIYAHAGHDAVWKVCATLLEFRVPFCHSDSFAEMAGARMELL
jgi:hypothetical protein